MIELALAVLTFAAAIGSGLTAGVFFAFSAFIMRALGRIPRETGIAAMQAINLAVLTPGFLVIFLGTAIVCLLLAALSGLAEPSRHGPFRLAACISYLVGTFGVTVICNVPLNRRLAALEPHAADAVEVWDDYLARWTAWNHARTLAAALAAGAFIVALV